MDDSALTVNQPSILGTSCEEAAKGLAGFSKLLGAAVWQTKQQPLRILHSVHTWLPQTETWLHTQVAALPPTIESHIVCADTANLEQFPLSCIHSHRREHVALRFWDRVVRKLCQRRQPRFWQRTGQRLRPAVWHSHFGNQAWADRPAVEATGARHVLSVYGADISQLTKCHPWNKRIPEMLQQVDLVLCEGPAMAAQVGALGCPRHRIQVHHLGVPLDGLPFQPRQWKPGTPLRVLIAGSFREKKGIPFALQALARVKEEVRLEITLLGDATGKPQELAEKERILSVIRTHQLSSLTRWLGFQPYSVLLRETREHHVFLSPSVQASDGDNEGGSPVAITEMAASGMVVVSTRHRDIPQVIIDGVTGLLADERDVAGLVHQLKWLIAHPAAWPALQENARRHIEREYNAKRQAACLAQRYYALVNSQR